MIKLLNAGLYPVKNPKFNVGKDAGIDFYCPAYNEKFFSILKEKNPKSDLKVENDENGYFVSLAPQKSLLVPTGFYTRFPSDIALIGFNKSGIATKKNLMVGACVDDSSYEGVLHLHVINVGDEAQKVYFDEKLVQFVPVKIDVSGVEVIEDITAEEFFKDHNSDRKDGGFGSTTLK